MIYVAHKKNCIGIMRTFFNMKWRLHVSPVIIGYERAFAINEKKKIKNFASPEYAYVDFD